MFRLFAFGGLRLEGPAGPIAGAAVQPRPLAILAILAVAGPAGISRDKLVGLLWPDRTEDRARHVLSQSLYALRRSLGAEDLFIPNGVLRLNPAVIGSDIGDFCDAIRFGNDDAAIALRTGPFLDSFYLSSVPEFESWTASERDRLDRQYSTALERLAQRAAAIGDHVRSIELHQKRANLDPLDSRAVLQLLHSMNAAGDRTAAIRRGDEHQELLRRELGISASHEISQLLHELRKSRGRRGQVPVSKPGSINRVGNVSDRVTSLPAVATAVTQSYPTADLPSAIATVPFSARWTIAAVVMGAIVLSAAVAFSSTSGDEKVSPIAVGFIRSHLAKDSALTARALPDLLATSLARIDGLDVISRARLYELTDVATAARDTGAAFAAAARRAGAKELVEGTLYATRTGLRLDVQRVDIGTGKVRRTYTVGGPDALSLIDRTTSLLADVYNLRSPEAPLGTVTSVSLVARSFYEEGLRAFYVADVLSAQRLFSAALSADSTFAMAAHYLALATVEASASADSYVDLARKLAQRSTDRERLLILHHWAAQFDDPAAFAYADTLSRRYPAEPEAQLAIARAELSRGDFAAAIGHLRSIVKAEGFSRARTGVRCRGCEAQAWLVSTLELADSLPAAELLIREALRTQGGERAFWGKLGTVLERQGRIVEADSAYSRESRMTGGTQEPLWRPVLWMRGGDFAASERHLRQVSGESVGAVRDRAYNLLAAVLRNRGRPREALEIAESIRRQALIANGGRALDPFVRLPLALALMQSGRAHEAAAQFDTMAALSPFKVAARTARHRSWMMAHRARALAIAGDTAALAPLADTVREVGAMSAYGRDRRLHYYVRGLIAESRRDWPRAVREFRKARFSSTETYLAVPLARAELATGDAGSAARTASAALRGPLDSQNQYELRSELHEVLADALLAVGDTAAAAKNYRIVADAWEGAERPFDRRGRRAREQWGLLTNVQLRAAGNALSARLISH